MCSPGGRRAPFLPSCPLFPRERATAIVRERHLILRSVGFIPFCVAVIDDDPDVLRIVRIKLERAGFRVETAGDAGTGLALVLRHHPDVVIADLMLPDRDGLDLVRDLKALSVDGVPVVLILSALNGTEGILRGLAAGADDYVTKPFSPRELAERITVALARAGRFAGPGEELAPGDAVPGAEGPAVADGTGEGA